MGISNPYEKYRENNVFTATKEELTLMLYEGALKFCNQAIAAIEAKDYMKANDMIIRVQDIITEFRLTLNRTMDISKHFETMYEYMYRRLVDANIKKDIQILCEVRDLIREFRDVWKEAMKASKKEQGAMSAAASNITI